LTNNKYVNIIYQYEQLTALV